MKKSSDVNESIFYTYKKYTLNKYWMGMLSSWEKNDFHKGISYDENRQVMIFEDDAGVTKKISVKNGTYDEFKKIIRECKKIGYSPTKDLDIINNSPKIEESIGDYKSIKPNNIKDDLRMDYIYRLAKYYNLSPLEVKQLVSIIQLAFQFHNLTSDDVVMKKGKIVNIKNLKFNKTNRKFYVVKNQKAPTEKVPVTKSNFHPFLERYIKDVARKKQVKN